MSEHTNNLEAIIGQRGAVETMRRALRLRALADTAPKTPLAFVFAGPEGCGKGFAAEQLAKADGLQLERSIYRIKSVQKNGQWRHEYEPLKPGDPVTVGEDLEVRLTVKNSATLEYLILEDHLPAGFEVRQADRDPRYANEAFYQGWYDHQERRETLMAWFVGYLPSGSHEFRFVVYPELKGKVLALPSAIWPMYRPELRGESSPWQVEVR